MNRWRIARLVATKDLQIERRSRVVVNQVLPFAAADDADVRVRDASNVLQRVAPGLVWLATRSACSYSCSGRSRSKPTTAPSTRFAWRCRSGRDLLGKALALAAQLAVLEVLLLIAAALLYGADIPAGGLFLLLVTLVPRRLDWPALGDAVRRPHCRVHWSAVRCSRCSCSRLWRPF